MRKCVDWLLDKLYSKYNYPPTIWVRVSDFEEQLYYRDNLYCYKCSPVLRYSPLVQQHDPQSKS
jgi:hypothetical protein